MKPSPFPAIAAVTLAAGALLASCGGGKQDEKAAQAGAESGQAVLATSGNSGEGPDTTGMDDIILAKINENPGVAGTASLKEFRRKSVNVESMGENAKSAVVEFEGAVVFSADVEWGMHGPTRAGEPHRFEAQVEYVNNGNGWQQFGPMGIYPL